MLKIIDHRVYNMENAVVASGFPLKDDIITPAYLKEAREDVAVYFNYINARPGIVEYDEQVERGHKHYKRAIRLAKADGASGHDCFLKGIMVDVTFQYPEYMAAQFLRYHWFDPESSTSTMHCIHKINIDEHVNEYVDECNIINVKHYVDIYNKMIKKHYTHVNLETNTYYTADDIAQFNENAIKNFKTQKYIYMKIVSNLPQGIQKTWAVTTNFLQLKTMYFQRRNHKLPEWHIFCNWIESLPFFKELIIENKL